ncbi:hypothetical protein VTH06DRAFT_5336 [Thermothelomyces fergusii]
MRTGARGHLLTFRLASLHFGTLRKPGNVVSAVSARPLRTEEKKKGNADRFRQNSNENNPPRYARSTFEAPISFFRGVEPVPFIFIFVEFRDKVAFGGKL